MLNLLVAYPYLRADIVKLIQANAEHTRFVLDSGAFTAWKAGNPIALDDYCRFIESLPFVPWRYFSLDVIGDPEGTLKNYKIMRDRGFNPVPIFTRGEDPSVLEEYYQTSDVVGIGGLVGTPGNKGFVKGIMDRVNGRKVHLLGFTALDFIKFYKPYMCDCSSWTCGARYARPAVYLGGGKLTHITKEQVLSNSVPPKVADALRRLGFDLARFRDPKNWDGTRSDSRILGAAAYVKLSLEMEERLGTYLFLASTTGIETTIVYEQYKKFRGI